jgi:hypothetical protein
MTLTTDKLRRRTLRRSVPVWGSDSAPGASAPEVLAPEARVPEASALEVWAREAWVPEGSVLLAEALHPCLRSALCWRHWCGSHLQ